MKSLDELDIGTKSNEGIELELLHPINREPLGMYITICGQYSERYIAHQRKVTNADLLKARQGKQKKPDDNIMEQAEARGTALLVACTIGWRHGESKALPFHGGKHEFTEEKCAELYASKSLPWVRLQVDRAIADDSNFIKG
jgi:hypothetical protein